MEIEQYRLEELLRFKVNMVDELTRAEKNDSTSLTFARHDLGKKRKIGRGPVQVLVVGGTNLISAVVEKGPDGPLILSSVKDTLPVCSTKERLFDFIAKHLSPEIDLVALNFAYPLAPVLNKGFLDGILLRGTKEHCFEGLVGNQVGDSLESYIYDTTGRNVEVTVANDTICLVLSGLSLYNGKKLAGGVVGTGFNFALFTDDTTVVNLESGNFNRFDQTDSGLLLDKESLNPGCQLWEKEISGGYLYKHYNKYAEQFALERRCIASTRELHEIAKGDSSDSIIAREVMKRSASLVAVQIGAVFEYKKNDSPVFLIEGSLFWKGHDYFRNVIQYLSDMGIILNPDRIISIENSSVIGAAHLLL